jgi:membrane protein YdbS with pleckstrin-like domain
MIPEWAWGASIALVLAVLAISLTTIPERYVEWRRRVKRELWDADSDGNID